MELNRDFESYRRVFQAQNRVGVTNEKAQGSTIYIIESSDEPSSERTILACFSEQEDMSDWIGKLKKELISVYRSRDLVALTEDSWIQALAQPLTGLGQDRHFLGQIAEFRQNLKQVLREESSLKPSSSAKIRASLLIRGRRGSGARTKAALKEREHLLDTHQNFVIEALSGWWLRFLPSQFGVYVRVENEQSTKVLLTIKAGRIDRFYSPDLGTIHPDRRSEFGTLVDSLSEKTLMPIQGVRVSSDEWSQWLRSPNPWTLVSRSIRSGRTQLAPFRWFVALLIGTRAFFGL